MKTLTPFILLLILLLGVGNYIQWRSANQENDNRISDNRKAQVQHIRDLRELGLRDSVISSLLNQRTNDSVTHAKTQGALKSKITALKTKSNWSFQFTSGIHYDSIIHGVGYVNGLIVKTYPIDWKDTVIVLQDSLIADLENERDTLYITDNQVIDSLQASVNQLKGMYQAQYLRANKAERDRRKRWSLGPHAGYGVKGPDFGVSIQYSLWRF